MRRDEPTTNWRSIIAALAVQTIIAGMVFYSATVRWMAQMEERIMWVRDRQTQNFEEHRQIIQLLREHMGQNHDPKN